MSARSVVVRIVRWSGPGLVRFAAYFGILGLLALGAGELIGSLTTPPSAMALGLRGSIAPDNRVALVPTEEKDWTEAAGALGLEGGGPGEDSMAPAPYLLQ